MLPKVDLCVQLFIHWLKDMRTHVKLLMDMHAFDLLELKVYVPKNLEAWFDGNGNSIDDLPLHGSAAVDCPLLPFAQPPNFPKPASITNLDTPTKGSNCV